jgi:uncharacterized ferritin-like protein (DUF455 family)
VKDCEGERGNFVLHIGNVRNKIMAVEESVHRLLLGGHESVPMMPARDVPTLPLSQHPAKKGLSSREGQARLLHDLASIELQAMELAYRSLIEFPEANGAFRHQLAELTLSESKHLSLCLDGIETLGFQWGAWPVHMALWEAVSAEDSLLDRLLIVHRYLEGSGLDAGESLLKKLTGVENTFVSQIVKTIVEEEVDHVNFGTYWYLEFCQQEGLDAGLDFPSRLKKLSAVLPRRLERLSVGLRQRAGFTNYELQVLESLRQAQLMRRAFDVPDTAG